MSNIHEVYIKADAPWDWASKLPDSEAACFASIALNPVMGVQIEQRSLGFVPNDHGGKTSMYEVVMSGEEGFSTGFLDRIASALATVGKVSRAEARDIENNSRWFALRTDVPRPMPCEGCGVLVSPRPGKGEPCKSGVFSSEEVSWAFTHKGRCPIRKEIMAADGHPDG